MTIRAFLVRSNPAADYPAPAASVQSYSEHDVIMSVTRAATVQAVLRGGLGASIRRGPEAGAAPEGPPAGNSKSGHRQLGTGGCLGRGRDRPRADRIGQHRLRQPGRLDDDRDRRQPIRPGTPGAGGRQHPPARRCRNSRWRRGRASTHALVRRGPKSPAGCCVEHAAEVSFSQTLHEDLTALRNDPGHLDPPPPPGQPVHLRRVHAAFATGYATHFDDGAAVFHLAGARRPEDPARLPAGTGILGAIRHGLRATGLVGDEHLTDSADTWRAITASFGPETLKAHPHDLLNVGIVHRILLPGPFATTRRITVNLTATPGRHRPRPPARRRRRHLRRPGAQAARKEGHRAPDVRRVGRCEPRARPLETDVPRRRQPRSGGSPRRRAVSVPTGRCATSAGQPRSRVAPGGQPSGGEGEEFRARARCPYRDLRGHRGSGAVDADPGSLRHRPGTDAQDQDVDRRGRRGKPRTYHDAPRRAASLHGRQPAGRAAPGPAAAPTVRILAADERSGPRGLELDLADHLQTVSLPGLEHVAEWAPTATLGPVAAESHVTGTVTAGGGVATPARLGKYAPTADLGVRLLTSLGNRAVRNDARRLFEGTFELPSPTDPPVRLAVRLGVIRPIGAGAPYDGLTFAEHADEPVVSWESGAAQAVYLALGGGDPDRRARPRCRGRPSAEPRPRARSATTSRTTGSSSRTLIPTAAGSPTTSPAHTDTPWRSVWPNPSKDCFPRTGRGGGRTVPEQVVHPRAATLPPDAVLRAAEVTRIQAEAVQRQRERADAGLPAFDSAPLRLVADLDGTATEDDFLRAAKAVADATGERVDLAFVLSRDGTAERLEHREIEPGVEAGRAWGGCAAGRAPWSASSMQP